MTTLLGEVVYERAYYHCGHCHSGQFPTDAEFGIERRQTRGAMEVISLMGVLAPFEEGACDVLPRLSGIGVSASTVQRTTEAVGADVAERRAVGQTFGPDEVWDWNRDAAGESVAYVGLDATGVRQQGPHAEKVEGRMPWVATVFNPQPTHEQPTHEQPTHEQPRRARMRRARMRRARIGESRYVAGLMSLEELGAQLRRECQAVGVDRADRVVALTDGGAGLENCLVGTLSGLAKEIVFILDFWHVADHLQQFANVLLSDDQQRRQTLGAWCHLLKHEGGRRLLEELEDPKRPDRAAPAVRESHRSLVGYLRHNLHRMDYPQYLARGWQIGSGQVESACKAVVGGRLKGPGMRWREPGTTALCQLRAIYKSQHHLWQYYWKRLTVS